MRTWDKLSLPVDVVGADPVRIGIIGAARIAPRAILEPARTSTSASVVAIASRDPDRASRLARRYAIQRVHVSYAHLLEDPDVDAVYIPLPNSLHAEWTRAALDAGKHVLCEKPMAANADQARVMQETAESTGLVLMEAFHYRHHPLAKRMRQLVASGLLGPLRHIEADFRVPMLRRNDIRLNYDLAGGAMMDLGCYTADMVRFVTAEEPEVLYARAALAAPNVDRWMTSFLRFPSGASGRMTVALRAWTMPMVRLRVRGERGVLDVINPILPQLFHQLRLRVDGSQATEQLSRTSTYAFQLEAFATCVRHATQPETDASNGVATMTLVDAVYQQAGLRRRGERQ